MEEERDVEVFERIPWESLEGKPDRRWMAYAAAAAIVLAAVGISIGRQIGSGTGAPATTLPTTPATLLVPPDTTVAVTVPPPSTTNVPATWTEADLMALPAESVEMAALAMAEWYVIDYFTRDDPDGARSFVEWARASELAWESPSEASVTVLVRRLAAADGDDYQRLETEAWQVGMSLDDHGWSVMPTPLKGEAPVLVRADEPGDAATSEWVDAAGVTWQVRDDESS